MTDDTDTASLVFQQPGDADWHVFDKDDGTSLCGEHELDPEAKTLTVWGDADEYEADRDCEACCRDAGIMDEQPLATDGGVPDYKINQAAMDSSGSGSFPSVTTTRSMPDPETAHAANLLGRRVRVDWGARSEVGQIREVRDDIERGRKLRIGFPNGDGGFSRCVTVDPRKEDIEMLPARGEE